MLSLRGRLRGIEAQQRERRWLVWHQAYLPNVKRPPRLSEFVGGVRETKPPKSADQMLAIAMQWNAAVNRTPKR